MNLSTVEEYLFAEREVVYEEVVAGSGENASGKTGKITDFEQFSKKKNYAACSEALRPTSLWRARISNGLAVRKSGRRNRWRASGAQQSGTSRNGSAARKISSTGLPWKTLPDQYAISPVTKKYADDSGSTIVTCGVASEEANGSKVRPAAIAASVQKDVVSEVAEKSWSATDDHADSIATAAKMSRLMNISGIVNL